MNQGKDESPSIGELMYLCQSDQRCFMVCSLLLLVSLPSLAGCGGRASSATELGLQADEVLEKLSVEVAEVATSRLVTDAAFSGNLLPRRRTMIVAEVEGSVLDIANIGPSIDIEVEGTRYSEKLGLLPGQEVKEGDVLVRLDPSAFELDVAVSEAKLAKAKADLSKLKAWDRPEAVERLNALVREAEARYRLSLSDHNRAKALTTAISESEFERTVMELKTAEAALASQRSVLEQSRAGPTVEEVAVQESLVKQAEAELRREQWLLAKTTIRAPYDGVITEVKIEEGDRVAPSDALCELLDLRYLVAEVGVPESLSGKVRLQDEARVSLAGSVGAVAGLVVAINRKVDPESRNFRIRVAIDNRAGRFKAGQFATVTLALRDESASTVIPTDALVFVEGQPHVFSIKRDQATLRQVTLGTSNGTHTEVMSGLEAGERIVVDDPAILSDGTEVVIREGTAVQ